ncbi:MAG TPA: VOC family protein [Beijerinckiaceae bacterium]|nr:VOC family protein [Beijerinckiaceae bacterium]
MCADSPAPYSRGARGIDHLVIAGRDLDALAEDYRRLGFTVGTRNRHPWGTENHIVQFPGCFLELIGVGSGAAIQPGQGRSYSFGGFVEHYLRRREGLAMLVLESRDARADAQAYAEARVGDFEPFFFERQGVKADGTAARVAFTLAFAAMKDAPLAGFFVCQQHEPQNFWNTLAQSHANGVFGISRVSLVADDPSDCHEFLGAFIGQRAMRATSFGLELETGRGIVEVLSAEGFAFRYGAPPLRTGTTPQFAAAMFRVADCDAAERFLAGAGVAAVRSPGGCLALRDELHGLRLAFEQQGVLP